MLLTLKIAAGLLVWSGIVVLVLSMFKINRPDSDELESLIK